MSKLQDTIDFIVRLDTRMDELNRELARHEGAREQVAAALEEALARVEETGKESEILDAVLGLLQGMEGAFQRNFQNSLATIVSEGLCQVFGGELEVRIEAGRKADMSSIRFQLIKDGQEEDIMEGQGGGYINIIAFLLRVLLILAARPLLRRLLVLDEPFAMVSPEFRHSTAEMAATLVDRLDFQMIMITQEWEYVSAADLAYKASLKDGATQLSVLKRAPGEAAAA